MARRSFTLVEMLVVVAITVILLALLLPSLAMTKEKARQLQCANNLRQCGIAMCSYSSDFNSYIVMVLYKGSGAGASTVRWLDCLNETYGTGYLTSRKVPLCPSFAPARYINSGHTYGSRYLFPSNPADSVPSGYNLDSLMVNMTRLTEPTSYLLLGDSFSSAYQMQVHGLRASASSGFGFHLRHPGTQGNILAADIHVAPAGYGNAISWGITGAFAGTQLISF